MTRPTTEAINHSKLTVCQHPLCQHYLVRLRHERTEPQLFRRALDEVSRLVLLEATTDLPLESVTIPTPVCTTEAHQLSSATPIVLVPILRAGLSVAQTALDLLPMASVYHLGLYRDEETLRPVTYYEKLPDSLASDDPTVFLLDPMLATGGSAIAAMQRLVEQGIKAARIRFVCLVASPEGVLAFQKAFPETPVYTATLDEKLNDKGYIVPGLGDAGDRTFGT